jgi:hypothetical protein
VESSLSWNGPGRVLGLLSLPPLFPQKCFGVSNVAEYLGKKYGDWVASVIGYGKGGSDKWIGVPISYAGNVMNYRKSSLKQAGFSKVPATTDAFLEYAKATRVQRTTCSSRFDRPRTQGTVSHSPPQSSSHIQCRSPRLRLVRLTRSGPRAAT